MTPGSDRQDYQRLLPYSLEARLLGVLARVTGFALLILAIGLGLSLMSWSVTDPSLTHTTGGRASNFLGPVGAVLSDLILQILGLASLLVLLAPMFWGVELITSERISSFKAKGAFYPLSILLMAGALSAVPAADAWPLHHGYGGILGDVVCRVAVSVFSLLNPDRAYLASGLLMSLTGASALSRSVGFELRQLMKAMTAQLKFREKADSWHQNLKAEAQRLAAGGFAAGASGSTPQPAYATIDEPHKSASLNSAQKRSWFAGRRADPMAFVKDDLDDLGVDASDTEADADDADDADQAHRSEPHWSAPVAGAAGGASMAGVFDQLSRLRPGSRDDDDDDDIETDGRPSSRSIAKRFAPFAVVASAPEPAEPSALPPKQLKMPFSGSSTRSKQAAQPVPKKPIGPKAPPINLLKRPLASKQAPELTQTALRGNARLLEDVLADYGVKGTMRDIRPGPVVTLFEFEPVRGTKSSRVIALADDIARSMSTTSVRAAVVSGRNAIGIELPNIKREPVLLREMFDAEIYQKSQATLPLALGKSIGGEPVVVDLARMPHLLVAGTTGSGKSVGVNAMILSLLYRLGPSQCRMIMIDPKMLELSVYNGIPHLLTPVVTDPQKAVAALNWVVGEMEERYKRMSKLAVRNIEAFNQKVRDAAGRGEKLARTVQTGFDRATGQPKYERQEFDLEPMPFIVVVVDEFADLMIVAGKDIEQAVQRLAQMARAAGIHLIMATQRPSVDIITGTIKANFPTRISFKVASKIDSRTILNEQGAEQLLGQGDMLFSSGAGQASRVHGAFVSDEEVEAVARFLREQGEPQYIDGVTDVANAGTETAPDGSGRGDGEQDLFERAVAIVMRDRKASISYVQRRLSIGYNRAADLIERMEREGLVTQASATGKREILGGSWPSAGAA